MKSAIVIFPGTNRERDMAIALHGATGHAPRMIWHKETTLGALDLIVLPGGFSHGDYLRCGAMAAQSPIMPAIRAFAERGGYVLGVCNGFQILTEAACCRAPCYVTPNSASFRATAICAWSGPTPPLPATTRPARYSARPWRMATAITSRTRTR